MIANDIACQIVMHITNKTNKTSVEQRVQNILSFPPLQLSMHLAYFILLPRRGTIFVIVAYMKGKFYKEYTSAPEVPVYA